MQKLQVTYTHCSPKIPDACGSFDEIEKKILYVNIYFVSELLLLHTIKQGLHLYMLLRERSTIMNASTGRPTMGEEVSHGVLECSQYVRCQSFTGGHREHVRHIYGGSEAT